jgi:hypothetical protein
MASLLAAVVAVATLAVTTRASADDTLVADVEQQLALSGVDQANRYLNAAGPTKMRALNRKTSECELGAVTLAVGLSRGSVAQATQAHVEALRVASGRCVRFVLALAAPAEIPRYCASLDAWTPGQTARELRRRIAAIDADALLSATQSGKACRAAYTHELQNTRVVLKKRA